MKTILFCLISIAFASCSMYNSRFDCPPGKGIGCQPVNEVLNLIVEKEEGEDLFVSDSGAALLLRNQERKNRCKQPQTLQQESKKLYLLKERSGDPVLIQAIEKKSSSS